MNDEWLSEWINKWLNAHMNEWMNEWISDWMKIWMNEWKTNLSLELLDASDFNSLQMHFRQHVSHLLNLLSDIGMKNNQILQLIMR